MNSIFRNIGYLSLLPISVLEKSHKKKREGPSKRTEYMGGDYDAPNSLQQLIPYH